MKLNHLKLTVVAVAVASIMQAQAQSKPDTSIERVEVTGSHIRRGDLEGPSPVTSLSAEDIIKITYCRPRHVFNPRQQQ